MWTATGYALAFFVLAAATMSVWLLPHSLRRSEAKWKAYGDASDEFYAKAAILIRDDRTPPNVLTMIDMLGRLLDKPFVARRLLWRSISGALRKHSEHPPEGARDFLREVDEMPEELYRVLLDAVVFATSASAARAGLMGDVLMNTLLYERRVSREAGKTMAVEMVASCRPLAA